MKMLLIVATTLLGACATVPVPPSKLAAPSARLMSSPKPLPDVKAADSLYETTAVCRAEYGRETGKLIGLQGYVNTILKK